MNSMKKVLEIEWNCDLVTNKYDKQAFEICDMSKCDIPLVFDSWLEILNKFLFVLPFYHKGTQRHNMETWVTCVPYKSIYANIYVPYKSLYINE